jgi:regulator of protease activity HflC (stomatin/prohibitin superfamily)
MLGVVKVIGEQESGVIFRLGRFREAVRGPARVRTIPGVDQLVVVDMRPTTIDIPRAQVITKDGAPLTVTAHVHARVVEPADAVLRAVDYLEATWQLAETALRAVFKEHDREEALFERGKLETILQQTIGDATAAWGVEVSAVEIEVGDAA